MKKTMRIRLYLFMIVTLVFNCCASSQSNLPGENKPAETVLKLEMKLSAFGVESDDFPSIDVSIDFINNTSTCKKWYYSPQFKDTTYSLSREDMEKALYLLNTSDLSKLKSTYTVKISDQPSSRTIIITDKKEITIDDYGLIGDHPLKELYKIVYKL